MLDAFWGAAGGKFADRWASVSAPALVFWLGGLLSWIWSRGGLGALRRFADVAGRQSAPAQVLLLAAALAGVAASGIVVQRLAAPSLRIIEGYWPSVFGPLLRWRTSAIRAKAERLEERFQALAAPVLGTKTATAEQRAEFVSVDQRLRRLPADGDYLPTRTGNTLRAGERRPEDKYGLDAVVAWPRLWLLLPADTRTALSQARAALDASVAAFIWALLFCAFTVLTWWALPVGIGVAVATYLYWIPDRAGVFADLLEAAFDVHRGILYASVRWPLPANPQEERPAGEELTSYLLRGRDSVTPTFTPAPPPPA